MSDPVWFRSLYWRIAFGFIAMLAILLLTQGLLFLWLTDRFVGASPARTPQQLAEYVAEDIATQLSKDPSTNLEQYVTQRFGRIYQPFVVALADGQRAANRPAMLPPGLDRGLTERIRRSLSSGETLGQGTPPPGETTGRQGTPGERGASQGEPFGRRGPRMPADIAQILVNGTVAGLVAVPTNPPPVFVALREIGPTLGWFGLGLLGVGATVTALLIFRPAHNRLRSLELAARALGEGRTEVRASEAGGDEVSALARTFNRMAADLESRAAALAVSDRTRRQLLADVSHELMTPLTAIRGYVETLSMPELSLEQQVRQRYLAIVEQETQKLEAIIGDLLDLAKLEGGGDTLKREAVPIAGLFDRVADRHEPEIRERRIGLDRTIAPGTPDVWGDPIRLEQAIQNVAANAIRHTPEGGRVTLAAGAAEDGGVRITVRDTGTGIPPEHLPRVFDRFYKVDAARAGTSVPSGSGLGLSIVKAIIDRHGGTVSASNAADGGAVFEILLPSSGE